MFSWRLADDTTTLVKCLKAFRAQAHFLKEENRKCTPQNDTLVLAKSNAKLKHTRLYLLRERLKGVELYECNPSLSNKRGIYEEHTT